RMEEPLKTKLTKLNGDYAQVKAYGANPPGEGHREG
ncbi:unnamed protein product, partial [marine sediment metagenome]